MRPSLRALLVMMMLLVLLPMLVAAGVLVASYRANEVRELETHALRLATIISMEETQVQEGAEHLLCALAHVSQDDPRQPLLQPSYMRELLAELSGYSNLGVVDADGSLLCAAAPYHGADENAASPVNVAHAGYFQLAQRTGRFVVGYCGHDGAPHVDSLYYAYPVMGPSGKMEQLYFAERNAYMIDALTRQLAQELPPGFRLTFVDVHGTQVGHGAVSGSGDTAPLDAALVASALRVRDGPGIITERVPGGRPDDRVLMAVAPTLGPVDEQDAFVIVSAPQRIARAGSYRAVRVIAIVLAVAMLFATSLGSLAAKGFVVSEVERLVESTGRLARGDLAVRIHGASRAQEFGRIADAFNAMAAAIAERENDRDRAQAELRAHADRLALLPQRLMQAQERERRRIARELHDDLGQQLTVLGLWLQGLKPGVADPAQRSRLDDAIGVVRELIDHVRHLALDLRPSVLDDLGLASALRYYVNEFSEQTGLGVDMYIADDVHALDPQVETVAFRLTQEALTNTLKHAQATRASVALSKHQDHLDLIIRDDGVGFDVAQATRQAAVGGSLGLVNMSERVALVGGALSIDSVLGEGTEIVARFPLGTATRVAREETA